jgi:RimJ/RimL family protein N-acetyltransferase
MTAHPPELIQINHPTLPLTLRRGQVADAELVVEAVQVSLPELKRFLPWAHNPESVSVDFQRARLATLREQWEAKTGFCYNMLAEIPGHGLVVVGIIALHQRRSPNPKAVEIGYWTRSGMSGQGICTRATQAIVLVALEELALERVQILSDKTNVASLRVIEKVGFKREGLLRSNLPTSSEPQQAEGLVCSGDSWISSLIQADLAGLIWRNEFRSSMSFPSDDST